MTAHTIYGLGGNDSDPFCASDAAFNDLNVYGSHRFIFRHLLIH